MKYLIATIVLLVLALLETALWISKFKGQRNRAIILVAMMERKDPASFIDGRDLMDLLKEKYGVRLKYGALYNHLWELRTAGALQSSDDIETYDGKKRRFRLSDPIGWKTAVFNPIDI